MQASDTLMQLMGVARTFKDSSERINSLDFHRSENLLITASDDDSIGIYDTAHGVEQRANVHSKKYGVCHLCTEPRPNCVLYASPEHKIPSGTLDPSWYNLRHHDLERNTYERWFRGHTAPVTGLTVCPASEAFLSTGLDNTLRVWDLRTTICQGVLNTKSPPIGTLDCQGVVFAASVGSDHVKLYDMRFYDRGPFKTISVPEETRSRSDYTCLRFSPDGRYLLGVVDGRVYVLDAFEGGVVCKFGTCASQESPPPMEAAFSPDSQYVVAGCTGNVLGVWRIDNPALVAQLHGHHAPPRCVKFAPRQLLMASACQTVQLWIPPLQAIEHSRNVDKVA